MPQYHPAGKVSADRYGEIDRRITNEEYLEAVRHAREAGLRRFDRR